VRVSTLTPATAPDTPAVEPYQPDLFAHSDDE
jgi:hypothetical protein